MIRAPIRAGLHLLNLPGVEPRALRGRLADVAVTAEASGFDSIFVMDHVHEIRSLPPEHQWTVEGNLAAVAIAAATSRVQVGLLVGGTTYRNPGLLAKMTTTLDVLSGGRAILGMGAGWNDVEHAAYGFAFPALSERFERLEESLRISRALFTQTEATFEGRYYTVHRARNEPRPLRGDIPILIGGNGERKTMRLVARYADAANLQDLDPDGVRRLVGVLHQHCEDAGRDPSEITVTMQVALLMGSTYEEAAAKRDSFFAGVAEDFKPKAPLIGDRDAIGEKLTALLDAGLDAVTVNMPDVADTEAVALAGEVLTAAMKNP